MKFKKTIAAIKAAQKSPWAIGDALLEECPIGKRGVKDGSLDLIEECAKEVARECGDDEAYSLSMLLKYRQIAHLFPDDKRLSSWSVCYYAKSPERLQKAIAEAKADNKPLTVEFVKDFDRSSEGKKRRNGVDLSKAIDRLVKQKAKQARLMTELEYKDTVHEVTTWIGQLQEFLRMMRDLRNPSKIKHPEPMFEGKVSHARH